METHDFSKLTGTDIKAIALRATEQELKLTIYDFAGEAKSVRVKAQLTLLGETYYIHVEFPNSEEELGESIPISVYGQDTWFIYSVWPRNLFPKYIKECPYNRDAPRITVEFNAGIYNSVFLPNIDKFQAAYEKIIATARAQSKEDFYDDASDYQDDEPTDFGDASNYDESLVRRIRKLIN